MYTKVRQPAHVHVLIRHFKSREHMTLSIGFVHASADPCACPRVSHWLVQYSAPMAHSYRLGLVTWRNQARIPVGTDICHRGCAFAVLQTVQRHGVYRAAYDTVHYKEPLKTFEIRVGHSPRVGLPSVAILP